MAQSESGSIRQLTNAARRECPRSQAYQARLRRFPRHRPVERPERHPPDHTARAETLRLGPRRRCPFPTQWTDRRRGQSSPAHCRSGIETYRPNGASHRRAPLPRMTIEVAETTRPKRVCSSRRRHIGMSGHDAAPSFGSRLQTDAIRCERRWIEDCGRSHHCTEWTDRGNGEEEVDVQCRRELLGEAHIGKDIAANHHRIGARSLACCDRHSRRAASFGAELERQPRR